MRIWILFLLLLPGATGYGQSRNCDIWYYKELIANGNSYAKSYKFDKAFEYYALALDVCPEKEAEADSLIQEVFQRMRSVEIPGVTLEVPTLKFGGKGHERLFHYVDKNGAVLEHLGYWKIAGVFINGKLATVKVKNGSRYDTFLLDTEGNKYPVAYELNGLHEGITALDLSFKQLKDIPLPVFEHPQLKVLLLNGNKIDSIPAAIGKMKNLQILFFRHNEIRALPDDFTLFLPNLTYLDMTGNKLTDLPMKFGDAPQLSSLHLSSNQLKSIPLSIGRLKNLKQLYLGGNQITALPAEIGQMKALNVLFANDNQLSTLPANIGGMSSLSTLNLYNNKLTSLPAEIANLKELTTLSLENNQLTDIPLSIGKLKNLTLLNLANNRLTVLPKEL
ncbi:MAG TPA: leucine-rich repeat domain-containing protein, partial [Saprospiraceae bacterium]|nr:leucine-rich repeat domain-containing protein [Saprospiraceae bacterium]